MDLSAILRVVPFIGFLLIVMWLLSGDAPSTLGIVLLGILGPTSVGVWFIGSARSENGD